ncbi:putative LRR receptor-like serine/threonine-protein kinase [Tetrabaena socialis]|uniref:Putative LRR receptor-like serine/threonine-protein kinase n=1 Tax=Tetrabaena socialis TaxID=47790 RepID=A0A2J7ZHX5_9CHLO|nr:putative LRR receptor-like serine/threonine-protein kinase [Tetrabaena socialis]|eukprot:PNG99871.1 putative LRR receptor-like serine/threonine-protein kinase [Tetrabaena socialis]
MTSLTTLNVYSTGICGPLPVWPSNASVQVDSSYTSLCPYPMDVLLYIKPIFDRDSNAQSRCALNWTDGTDPCADEWTYVVCEGGTLSGLVLAGCSAPLDYFEIASFTPTIPAELFLLTDLKVLDFSRSNVTGSIPAGLTNLVGLQSLTVREGYLTGPLPGDLSLLTSLTKLDLRDNALSGPLEDLPPLPTALIALDLGLQNVKGPGLSGFFATGWDGLPATLRELHLDGNVLPGQLVAPTGLSILQELSSLLLNDNSLTGPLPAFFSSFTALQVLNLSDNRYQGGTTLPSEWSTLARLRDLSLVSNGLIQAIPAGWSAMVLLESLDLSDNQLTGALSPLFSSWTEMAWLDLSSNTFSGDFPTFVAAFAQLNHLNLSYQGYAGFTPGPLYDGLSSLAVLSALDLKDCMAPGGFNGSFPEGVLSGLTGLVSLRLQADALDGTLPDSWSALTGLTCLELTPNSADYSGGTHLNATLLVGTLPATWAAMTGLKVLNLSRLNLESTLPAAWSRLASLTALDLSGNRLYGSIPDAWVPTRNSPTTGLVSAVRISLGDQRDWFFCGDVANGGMWPSGSLPISGLRYCEASTGIYICSVACWDFEAAIALTDIKYDWRPESHTIYSACDLGTWARGSDPCSPEWAYVNCSGSAFDTVRSVQQLRLRDCDVASSAERLQPTVPHQLR